MLGPVLVGRISLDDEKPNTSDRSQPAFKVTLGEIVIMIIIIISSVEFIEHDSRQKEAERDTHTEKVSSWMLMSCELQRITSG